jgi:hypothetical protein
MDQEGMEAKVKPSLRAILADLLVGIGSKILMARAFPEADVWEDWTPWKETPIEDQLESISTETAPVDSTLCTPLPEPSPAIATDDFLLPIIGLSKVFGFRPKAVAAMINVPEPVLESWLTRQVAPVGENRKKVAMLAAMYDQLTRHFDGKPYRAFLTWLGTPLTGLGNRCPAQALIDGNALPVLNFLVLWSVWEDSQGRKG